MARKTCCAAAALFVALALPAAAHAGVEAWDGVWNTTNPFGHPILNLTQEPKSEPGPQVHGAFKDDSGVRIGKIQGDLSSQGQVWTGTYKNNKSGDKGKFKVELTAIDAFDGWFKTCGTFTCSEKYDWTGVHA